MDNGQYNRLKGLSARQSDCLRLISLGHDLPGMCSALGITKSTGEKHLAAARRTLQVSSTVEAVVMYMSLDRDSTQRYQRIVDTYLTDTKQSGSLVTLIDNLDNSNSLDEAWNSLNHYLSQLGFEQSILGLIAEPFGSITTGARLVKSSFPAEFMQFYELSGGAAVDPIARRISSCGESFLSDVRDLAKQQFGTLPENVRRLSEVTADLDLGQLMVVPGRDELTDAPFCISVGVELGLKKMSLPDFERNTSELTMALDAFWRVCRRRKYLSSVSGLSARHIEALSHAARGFRIDEVADQMNLSQRGTEKLLSNARRQLNATTTSSAIYRALVYGAI